MSEPELLWLAGGAAEHTHILEVGSWLGRSTRALADNTQGVVCAVDTWQGEGIVERELVTANLFDQFERNMQGARVIPMRMSSLEAAKLCASKQYTFDMIFLDGDHSYESVKADIAAWRPLCNGLLCGHDYGKADFPGVTQAVDEIRGRLQVGSIWAI